MKRLIVNADDFGFDPRRNEGILAAADRGIVRSFSAFAGAPLPRGDVGLHLNLSDGRPLLPGHRTLVESDGRFWGKEEARRRAREGAFDPSEVERETEAQLSRLARASHLDGHHHIHIYGPVAEPIARAASRAGVRWVRRPVELLRTLASPARERQLDAYRRLAEEAMPVYARYGLRWTDHFMGSALTGILDVPRLKAGLLAVPHGVTELMVHPGRASAPDGFEGPDRERELEALLDPGVLGEVRRLNIELISFADLC